MKLFESLDRGDRRLLLWSVSIAVVLAAVTGFLIPNENNNDNRLPSSYLAGRHGARAAYETLLRANYPIERWERPLRELAATAGPQTVVIFAEPFSREQDDIRAVRQIVERGGRVLSTGYWGGFLLPGDAPSPPAEFTFAACQLEPDGIDPLADSGEVWMVPEAAWQLGNPAQHVEYTCGGQPAVIQYDWGKGHVVWWASATPLENAFLARGQNLDLLLNSLGPRTGHQFYWDESLHGDVRSDWSYAAGPALTMLRLGLLVLGLAVVFSFSRRSGPVRDTQPQVRTTPIEFLDALGSLYRNAGAASTTVAIAWERFKRHALLLCGLRSSAMNAAELAAAIRRRFPTADAALESDLAACEEAAQDETLKLNRALKLVQALHGHEKALVIAAKRDGWAAQAAPNDNEREEKAS